MTKVRRAIRRADGSMAVKYKRGPYQTDSVERGREICITLEPLTCTVRLKGTRTKLQVPWSAVYTMAAGFEARRIAREKDKARKERRKVNSIRRGVLRAA